MALIGVSRLDNLYDGVAGTVAISQTDTGEVVGVVQELLRNHNLRKVPGAKHVTESAVPTDPIADKFGEFGRYTKRAVKYFQQTHSLPVSDPPIVDIQTFRQLVQVKAQTPSPGRAYLTRKLDIADSVLCRVATLIGSFEESAKNGGFRNWKPQDAADANKTGLSYGLLQWTHGSKRLGDVLDRFNQLSTLFQSVFGVDAVGAVAMISHAKAGENVLTDSGDPSDAAKAHLNFQRKILWQAKFLSAGEALAFQILQFEQAMTDLRAVHTAKHTDWTKITSQRGWGFMLDLANQRGTGGANSKYNAAATALPAGIESQILEHIENDEIASYKPRRHFFRVDSPLPNNVAFPSNP